MDKVTSNTQTSLHISEEVVATIANEAIKEIAGVAKLANLPVKTTLFSNNPSAARPVCIDLNVDVAQIDIGIVVRQNYRLKDVCERVQSVVKATVQNMTGVAVSKVNVYVAGVELAEEQTPDA